MARFNRLLDKGLALLVLSCSADNVSTLGKRLASMFLCCGLERAAPFKSKHATEPQIEKPV